MGIDQGYIDVQLGVFLVLRIGIELNITGTIRSTGSLKPNYASRTQPFHEKSKHGQNKNIDRQTGQNSRKNSFYKDVK